MVPIRELRWRIDNGALYQSTDGGRYKKVAARHQIATAMFGVGELTVHVSKDVRRSSTGPVKSRRIVWGRRQSMADCLAILKGKLSDRAEVIDIDRHAKLNPLSGVEARGFKLSVRGLGTIFAIKRHVLVNWIPGSMPLGRFLSDLDDRGWLIRGADGMTTRQVAVPGSGRCRFYCLKLAAAFGDPQGDDDSRKIDQGRVGRDRVRGFARLKPTDRPRDTRSIRNWSPNWE
jgi:hypothetical protein